MSRALRLLALCAILAPRRGLPAPASPAEPSTSGDRVTAPGAKLVKLAEEFVFTEGPACDAEGNVYFTDQPDDRILVWSVQGKLSTFLQPAGRSNGLYFDARGNLLACADQKNELWSIAPDKKVTVRVGRAGGKLLNGPNDLWVGPRGGVWFTDPYYERPYWNRGPMEQSGQHVWYLAPGSREPTPVARDLEQPNGIVGTPDGKTLYVADIRAKKTYRYSIRPDGRLADKTLFCDMGSDGMTIDEEGHVYLTGRGVTVFDRSGRRVEHIAVDEGWTANVCFGGRDRRTIFITAKDSLYSIRARVRGAGFLLVRRS